MTLVKLIAIVICVCIAVKSGLELLADLRAKENDGTSAFEAEFDPDTIVLTEITYLKHTEIPMGTANRSKLSISDGLELKTASIPGAGTGVFATKLIKKGTFSEYGGVLRKPGDPTNSGTNIYTWSIADRYNKSLYWRLDAEDSAYSDWPRYVNAASFREQQNTVPVIYKEHIYYLAIQDIQPGEELFAWCGFGYANSYGFITPSPTNGAQKVKLPMEDIHIKSGNCLKDNELKGWSDDCDQEAKLEMTSEMTAPPIGNLVEFLSKLIDDSQKMRYIPSVRLLKDKPVSWGHENRAELTAPDEVVIKPSTIEDAGQGVFAAKDMPLGTAFLLEGEYFVRGERDTAYYWDVGRHRETHTKTQSVTKVYDIDQKNERKSNWLRYVNSANHYEQMNMGVFYYGNVTNRNVYFVTIKDIPAGEELLCWYGMSDAAKYKFKIPENKSQIKINLKIQAKKLMGGDIDPICANEVNKTEECRAREIEREKHETLPILFPPKLNEVTYSSPVEVIEACKDPDMKEYMKTIVSKHKSYSLRHSNVN